MHVLGYKIRMLLSAGLARSRALRLGREEGQTFVEYAMILALVVVTMAAALTFMHDQIQAFYTQVSTTFHDALS